MAVLRLARWPVSKEVYDAVVAEMRLHTEHPIGLIMHSASHIDGELQVMQVWDSVEFAVRFEEDVLEPALRASGVTQAGRGSPLRATRLGNALADAAALRSAEMIHLVTAEEIAALNALMAGSRTAREVAARTSRNAWAVLRSMELREPALAVSEEDRELGEVWNPTLLGVAALEGEPAPGPAGGRGLGRGLAAAYRQAHVPRARRGGSCRQPGTPCWGELTGQGAAADRAHRDPRAVCPPGTSPATVFDQAGLIAQRRSASARSLCSAISAFAALSTPEETMATGTVKWFSDDKGFGFITPDDQSKDLFVHHTAIVGEGYRSLAEGAKVSYDAEPGDKGPKAANVQVV